jgi:hypothetical protein
MRSDVPRVATQDPDLSLVSLSALLGELEHRFDASVFMGLQIVESIDDARERVGKFGYTPSWSGETLRCVGLANRLTSIIEHAIAGSEEVDQEGG